MANAIAGGTAAVSHVGAFDASAVKDVQDTLCQGAATVLSGSTDAIPFPGIVIINSSGVDATTLAAPVAGPQPAGDDGKSVTVIINTAQAHTITTPANKINTNKHVVTFTAAIGNTVELTAWNGSWYATVQTGVASIA